MRFISLIILFIFAVNPVFSSSESIISLLQEGKLDSLKKMAGKSDREVENLFLSALFQPDGKNAAEIYRKIWKESREDPLAKEALKRLYQYYYALGAYNNADSLARILDIHSPSAIPQDTTINKSSGYDEGKVFVQVGAFSDLVNASKVKYKLQDNGYQVKIVERNSEGRSLFIVRVGGYFTKSEADSAAKSIEKFMGVKTRVTSEEP